MCLGILLVDVLRVTRFLQCTEIKVMAKIVVAY